MCKLSELNQANRDGVWRPARRRPALSVLVLVLVTVIGRTEIYAVDQSDTFYGAGALANVTTGFDDSAFGYETLASDTTGNSNTASGAHALSVNTTGSNNTASGDGALYSNTTGYENTASGAQALFNNTTGSDNCAVGQLALYSNTDGSYNTAVGEAAMYYNNGNNNTAIGWSAINKNTSGSSNTGAGYQALYSNTTGNSNTASGAFALYSNTTGTYNTASGSLALSNNNGAYNTASGFGALGLNTTGSSNTADGLFALLHNTTGSNNIAIGLSAGANLTTGSGNIDIGNAGVAAESNTIRIGTSQSSAFVAGVRNAVVTGGVAVYAAANGKLGTNPSSERFKHQISDMGQRSEAILALRPVSFRYKKELDPKQVTQFGLVAEEVAKVDPNLVVRDEKGALYSVRYEAVNAMLLNEFLKEHRKVQELESNAATQQKQIEALTVGLQKVNAKLEVRKAVPQTVLSDQ